MKFRGTEIEEQKMQCTEFKFPDRSYKDINGTPITDASRGKTCMFRISVD